ncbi:MAG: hypothetical protein [Microviridae sp.]|nr:MAG: hypothetical protein [Microviridae sp.]
MKQTDKVKQKSEKTPQSEPLRLVAEETRKQPSTGLNEQGEELVQRDEVENTPFIVITINNESFGTFGKYRITETYHTKQQCKAELKAITWNRIVQIMTLVNEIMKEQTTKK